MGTTHIQYRYLEKKMSGSSSRQKGAAAEREVAMMLTRVVKTYFPDEQPRRNLDQARDGGYDLVGVPRLAIEVKRHERIRLNPWWEQTLKQATDGLLPILIYRSNGNPWTVQMLSSDYVGSQELVGNPATITMDFHRFEEWLDYFYKTNYVEGESKK